MQPGSGPANFFDPGLADLPTALPVFPLTNALLLPGGQLPLNVFEPRYLALTRFALAQPMRLIGMVQPEEAGAERNLDPDFVPPLRRVGCAGRIVSFEETPDGRYHLVLAGLIRFRIRAEMPRDPSGFRLVLPDFGSFAEDLDEPSFALADRKRLLAALKSFLKARQARLSWESVEDVNDQDLVIALAQMSPLSPDERQSLLECDNLEMLGEMLLALYEIHGAESAGGERRLH